MVPLFLLVVRLVWGDLQRVTRRGRLAAPTKGKPRRCRAPPPLYVGVFSPPACASSVAYRRRGMGAAVRCCLGNREYGYELDAGDACLDMGSDRRRPSNSPLEAS